jgi:hypothetical protein
MTCANEDLQKDKISAGFKARLEHLGPQQKVRVVILLCTKDAEKVSGRRGVREDRQRVIEAIRKSAEQALMDIDSILQRFGGQRLATTPDALGSIPVEITAAGVTALATSEHVKAILEDQTIGRVEKGLNKFA